MQRTAQQLSGYTAMDQAQHHGRNNDMRPPMEQQRAPQRSGQSRSVQTRPQQPSQRAQSHPQEQRPNQPPAQWQAQNNQRKQQSRNTLPAANFNEIGSVLDGAKDSFEKIAKSSGLDIRFYEEAIYAKQLIEANFNNSNNKDFSLAYATHESIKKSLVLVANSGLTLNPQLGLAYLVPRWNKNLKRVECHLEPSYKGLRRLGIDSGAIDSAVAELVYKNDDFKWVDRFTKPIHEYNPFDSKARGELVGGYCLARRPDGSFICTPVSMELINKVRNLSFGAVWNEWFEQMVAKSIIRQGFKDWPINSTGPIAMRLSAMQDYLKGVDANTDTVPEYDTQPVVSGHDEHLPYHEDMPYYQPQY
ncbi:TPA: recombinase RecT [Vibrio parahaemolyticus]|nr:recombinase RecT [Vibrio parahaemolyticus]MDF5646679.1 recombinase RecT [Vibrio parahaemolyticus]MDF5666062.1 recombinase RecT [Vibrio parahaemolyticus]WKV19312.1 hypothetical protein [Vibrio parahaemolyticus]HBC3540430.1 recombinase RecT [Vibrio parahaemolyticus]HBC3816818.1 recombinase RecT [Vibrio parahaemolyticus]